MFKEYSHRALGMRGRVRERGVRGEREREREG